LTPAPSRIVAHVDMDSFYASAEVRRDASLRDKPVVIGADPKEGKGRGVVVSCNYPARKFGLRSAMPISEAWRLCPDAVYLRPDFEYYESISSQVMEIIRRRVKGFEQVSIDEAFIELTGVVATMEEAETLALGIKDELRTRTGLTCSIGLAENKSSAKIATDLHKPDGITVISPGKTKEFLAPLSVSAIPGVGVKTEQQLKEMGVTKVGDVQRLEADVVRRRLGATGIWIWEVANGMENEPVKERELQSVSTERTLQEDSQDWSVIEGTVADLASELGDRALSAHIVFRKVGIKVRFRGFETHTREVKLATYSNDKDTILREARSLLKSFQYKKVPVRLVGLRLSDVRREAPDQTTISFWVEKKEEG
jgi:DNA polymerase IV (archaeal DinB-like DNA polymerase)